MLDALSPQRRRVVLLAAALALVLVVALAVTTVLRLRAEAVRPVAQDRPGPVLLVPGYGGRGASLQPLADALRAAGREAVVVPPVGDGTGDLQAQADHLDEVARQVVADRQVPSVDVVGYSAGGVVARLWVRDRGGSLVRRVLTLGSPQHGTSQAALGRELAGGCPTACEQLVPGSDLLRRLNARDETPAGPAWVTIRSSNDQVVTPVESAALDGALNLLVQDACPGATTSHGELPSTPYVLTTAVALLGPGTPTEPSPPTC